jgi:DNA topoisomerase 2-associated protein PAT1
MSFFGFDTTLPRDRVPQDGQRGIFDTPDPFAEVARAQAAAHHGDDNDV